MINVDARLVGLVEGVDLCHRNWIVCPGKDDEVVGVDYDGVQRGGWVRLMARMMERSVSEISCGIVVVVQSERERVGSLMREILWIFFVLKEFRI